MKIGELCSYAPKSQIKAGEAIEGAKYMFFTSSADENKRYSEYQFDGEGIIMGTGGNATLHYYSGKYSTSTDCVVLLPNEKVRCKYLYYYLKANMNVLEAGFKGAGLKHTNKKYINDICIDNIPDCGKQDKIIYILDKIQGIIDSKNQELKWLDYLIKARFVELFGDPVINPYGYDKVALSDLADIKIGPFGSFLHKHDYIELCYVWSGTCQQTIEGRKVETRQGDMCIFDTQAVHSIDAGGENDIVVNILMRKEFFDGAFLSRMPGQGIVSEFLADSVTKSRKKRHYLLFHSRKNPRVHDIMEHIMMEYYTEDIGMREVLESYVIILFTELLRTWRDETREQAAVSQEVQILELLSYIEDNYETCTLPEMGKAFGMHGNYLTALLKEKTGRSFVEHVQEQRLKKARALLETTDMPLSELIPLCGYNNMNFFYRKFREAEGCTPARYRKEHRK